MRLAIYFFAFAFLTTPVWAHVNPKWCAEQKQRPPKNPVPGQFPGPAEHSKMNNIELGSFDLAREIPGMLGRSVRTRFWMMEPGGIIAEHCHEDRPAFVYLLQGEVVETIEVKGKPVVRVLKAGQRISTSPPVPQSVETSVLPPAKTAEVIPPGPSRCAEHDSGSAARQVSTELHHLPAGDQG